MDDLRQELEFYRQQCKQLSARVAQLQESQALARHEAIRNRMTATLVRKAYQIAGTNTALEETTLLFLNIVRETLGVDCASFFSYEPDKGGFVATYALGFPEAAQLVFDLDDTPEDFCFRNSKDHCCPKALLLSDALNVPYFLWAFESMSGLGLFLGNTTEDSYLRCPLTEDDREIVEGALNVFVDINERRRAEESLQYRFEFENLLSDISLEFINMPHDRVDEGIRKALGTIANFAGAVQSSVILMDPDGKHFTNTHEWCARPGESQMADFQHVQALWARHFIRDLGQSKDIVVGVPDDIPEAAAVEKRWLKRQGFRPLLFVPMLYKERLYGTIGFYGEKGETRTWPPDLVMLLHFVADIVVNALERKRSQSALRKSEAERHNLEIQVQQAQKLESLGVLAGGIAHDFNNLLMGILGNADLALDVLPANSPARESLCEIEIASERAADLCRQMLAYSGQGKFVVERIDLNEIVREMVHLLHVSIAKKVELHCSFAGDLPSIEADATQIRQIVMNLITNASEAINEQEGEVTITTGAITCNRLFLNDPHLDEQLAEGVYAYIEVIDTGCGMSPEVQEKIYEPFFTTKFTGRGLGMAAVMGIVRGHRGTIRLKSDVGKGTSFRVFFPVADGPPVARVATVTSPAHVEEPLVTRAAPEESPEHEAALATVLLVDDEEVVRVVGARMLRRAGFSVLTAEDGHQALDLFRAHIDDIDCVLLDLTMPHMDGEETFAELRGLRSDVSVILSSGYNEQDVVERFAGPDLAGFIQKPYRSSALIAKIRNVLAARQPS